MPNSSSAESSAPRSLATAGLPRRVRRVLEQALALVSEDLDGNLGLMLSEFEQELFRLADQARNPGSESSYMQTLRTFRLNRSDLVPHFMLELEASVAGIRSGAQASPAAMDPSLPSTGFGKLSLVDEAVMDEGTVLREIASRQENRANLPLHLLGQRFGVLAAAPAFDAERIPLGPQSLCRALRAASQALQIEHDSRLLLYRIFDRQVMATYSRVLERLDELLDREGILRGLTYVPLRVRAPSVEPGGTAHDGGSADGPRPHRSGQRAGAAQEGGTGEGRGAGGPRGAWPGGQRPHTAWMGEPPEPMDDDENAAIDKLLQLLGGRREVLGKLRQGRVVAPQDQMSTSEVFEALGHLQAQPLSTPGAPQTLADVKQTLLAQARQRKGAKADLSPQDSDTFELLSMLYTHLEDEIRRDAPGAALVRRLQVPLLRVALQDRAFFVRNRHPARQLLNTVAETAAKWLDDNDFDPQFLAPVQKAVNHVIEKFDGDQEVFAASNELLQTHLQAQVRKAELLERRHTEAARGKEKLEVAKLRAADMMNAAIGEQRLPKFTRALLNQAWADVLTLTLLRQGEDSDAWRKQLDVTRDIVAACTREDVAPDPGLTAHVEAALTQVGYHGEEATVIAQRLTSNTPETEDDPASRTELAMRLKARARLGDDAKASKPKLPPRTPEEQARYEQLRVLPFGTWIEFVTNQQGDVVRRRLSWFSPITDNALFVNQRGQRVGEQSLDGVARMLANGQARIVTADRGRLVDRAWQAAVSALRSFAGVGERDATDGARA
jgi:hypothetical protein